MNNIKTVPKGTWKRTALIVAFSAGLITSVGCHVQQTAPYRAYFWHQDLRAKEVHLFIDDHDRGILPFMSGTSARDTGFIKKIALPVTVRSGKYDISLRDGKGMVISRGLLTLKNFAGSKTISYHSDNPEAVKVLF